MFRSGARSQPLSWPLPAADAATPWLEAAPRPLVACRNGLHACRATDLAHWISDELCQVELDGECISVPDALVARRARLVRRIERWEAAEVRAEFAQRCVARARAALTASVVPSAMPVGETSSRASQYLAQAESFAGADNPAVAAYVAALAFGARVPAASAMTAFRAERAEQGALLAAVLGLG